MLTRDELIEQCQLNEADVLTALRVIKSVRMRNDITVAAAVKLLESSHVDDTRKRNWRFRITLWNPRGDAFRTSGGKPEEAEHAPDRHAPTYQGLEAMARAAAQGTIAAHGARAGDMIEQAFLSRLKGLRVSLTRTGTGIATWRIPYATADEGGWWAVVVVQQVNAHTDAASPQADDYARDPRTGLLRRVTKSQP